jgi:hypothetical protein
MGVSVCTSIHFLRKPFNRHHTYNGINIKTSEEVANLGVIITSDTSWRKHIRNIFGVALKKLGFIKRVLGTDEKVKERCYFALVKPYLEYDWDPAHKYSILQIKKYKGKQRVLIKTAASEQRVWHAF